MVTDGWDEDFVELMLEKYVGVDISAVEREQSGRRLASLTDTSASTR